MKWYMVMVKVFEEEIVPFQRYSESAQDAVDSVRERLKPGEKIDSVYVEEDGWH